ncbi:MAG: hydroxymethylglutaryl-CoA lyase [Flavobacteriales bacterium]|nr:hydroxymethylglutaryl-CoA lyase [Flavobacteriales bacterium]
MKIIECPRDAMQGLHEFIPTAIKARYINQLLEVGFDTIDFGSFVSPKAIPQMKDTAEVLEMLDLSTTKSKLLAIVANPRGAADACSFEEINYLGYPFSISEQFQQRNTNATLEESLARVEEIQSMCLKHGKELVIYISMAFGNPYGEHWHPDIAAEWTRRLAEELDIRIIALSDTIGSSEPETIRPLFSTLVPEFSQVEFGAHFHTSPHNWEEKIRSAYDAGCRRFDGAIKGFGGCPMAQDELTGNMPTENMLTFFANEGLELGFNEEAMLESLRMAAEVFPL